MENRKIGKFVDLRDILRTEEKKELYRENNRWSSIQGRQECSQENFRK
jgi:hypothetical protein